VKEKKKHCSFCPLFFPVLIFGRTPALETVRHVIEDCECLEDTRFTYLGASYVRDGRVFLRDTELIPKTVKFVLATGLLGQFAGLTKTLSPL